MTVSITKPTVGGSEDTWGETINTALDTIVSAINTTDAALSTLDTDFTALTSGDGSLTVGSGGSLNIGDYGFTEASGDLIISYSGTNIMRLDASGNLSVKGNLNTNQTL